MISSNKYNQLLSRMDDMLQHKKERNIQIRLHATDKICLSM